MAFDQRIEADQIDDYNLLSALVSAPLWILGSVLGRKNSGDDGDASLPTKTLLAGDDGSKGSECGSPSRRGLSRYNYRRENSSTLECDRQSRALSAFGPPGLRQSKNLSWSDESGKSLVEYNDESVRHEPNPYATSTSTTAPKPVKSALRRSRSAKTQDGIGSDGTRYIPKMPAAKSSLVMPSRPYNGDSLGGMESPQLGYGFYTNITPPTPEMYQKSTKALDGAPPLPSTTTNSKPHHNQVFQSLQNDKGHMGWTSVPV